jgi:hypothetical protein
MHIDYKKYTTYPYLYFLCDWLLYACSLATVGTVPIPEEDHPEPIDQEPNIEEEYVSDGKSHRPLTLMVFARK